MKHALALFLILLSLPAGAQTLEGEAEVIRPYVFNLAGHEVYLRGIDSVEIGQICVVGRLQWECWAAALRELQTILAEGRAVCSIVVGPTEDNRVIAECSVNGEDVGERFLRSGFAIAIPAEMPRYIPVEDDARHAGRGLWQSHFAPPSIWRGLPATPRSNRPPFDPVAPVQ